MHTDEEKQQTLYGKIYWVPSEQMEAGYWPCMVVKEQNKLLLPKIYRPIRETVDDVLVRRFCTGELVYEDATTSLLNFVKASGWQLLLERKDVRIRKACEYAYYFLDNKSTVLAVSNRMKVREMILERDRLEMRMKETEEALRKIKKPKEKVPRDPGIDGDNDATLSTNDEPVNGKQDPEPDRTYTYTKKRTEKEEGKVVWAKKSGFPWWPSIVLNEEKEFKFVGTNAPMRTNESQILIRFFADGYHDFLENKPAYIRPFDRESPTPPQGPKKIRKDVQEAIGAAIEWLEDSTEGGDSRVEESEDEQVESSEEYESCNSDSQEPKENKIHKNSA